jgi:acetylornithine/succinyldiaminopimelate/putrescine aminotransferase
MKPLLSLDESLSLGTQQANKLYDAHVNRYLLQIFKIIGTSEMDIQGAQGVEIRLNDGRRVLDFSGGIGVVGVGHNHPRIIKAEERCHKELLIDSIRMAPHKLNAALAYNIAQLLPDPLNVSYFSVSGSEAVESALKLCERAQGARKKKFICMEGSFHGKTHGSLSVTTAHRFQDGFMMGIPAENIITVTPGDIGSVEAVIRDRTNGDSNDIIALILEPISGEDASVPPDGYLKNVASLCRDNRILTIFDEVKVGMGRSGKFCAFQHEDVVPDVVTIAKALGGAKRAIGAMVTSQELFDRAYGSKKDATLHSCSFGGLGESCAVAIETLNILLDEGLIKRAGEYGAYFQNKLEALQEKHPKSILEVRGKGLFRAIRLNFHQDLIEKVMDHSKSALFKTYESVLISAMVRELYEQHHILVHFQPGATDVMHFMPPLVVEKEQIDAAINGLDKILTRGIADATIHFVMKNIKQLFSPE